MLKTYLRSNIKVPIGIADGWAKAIKEAMNDTVQSYVPPKDSKSGINTDAQ